MDTAKTFKQIYKSTIDNTKTFLGNDVSISWVASISLGK